MEGSAELAGAEAAVESLAEEVIERTPLDELLLHVEQLAETTKQHLDAIIDKIKNIGAAPSAEVTLPTDAVASPAATVDESSAAVAAAADPVADAPVDPPVDAPVEAAPVEAAAVSTPDQAATLTPPVEPPVAAAQLPGADGPVNP